MRAVFDTNVFVSAFVVQGSKGEEALLLAQRRRVDLFTSVAILTETARTLRMKFDQDEGDIRHALRLIGRMSTVVQPRRRVTVLDDEPDNRILECAVEAGADVVVTGDRHLLKLRRFEGASIIRLADFLRMFPEVGKV
jgi:uncharacterized protein